jgi:hypothetical protein
MDYIKFTGENPAYEICCIQWESMLEETGIDAMNCELEIYTEEFDMGYSVTFHTLSKMVELYFPNVAGYFIRVRNHIKGFGPKQSEMFKVFEEDNFNFLPLIKAFIDHHVDLREQYEIQQKILSVEDPALEQVFDELKDDMTVIKHYSIQQTKLADAILDFANIKSLEIYPEIINSNPEFITKFEKTLVPWVAQLAQDITALAMKAGEEQ